MGSNMAIFSFHNEFQKMQEQKHWIMGNYVNPFLWKVIECSGLAKLTNASSYIIYLFRVYYYKWPWNPWNDLEYSKEENYGTSHGQYPLLWVGGVQQSHTGSQRGEKCNSYFSCTSVWLLTQMLS